MTIKDKIDRVLKAGLAGLVLAGNINFGNGCAGQEFEENREERPVIELKKPRSLEDYVIRQDIRGWKFENYSLDRESEYFEKSAEIRYRKGKNELNILLGIFKEGVTDRIIRENPEFKEFLRDAEVISLDGFRGFKIELKNPGGRYQAASFLTEKGVLYVYTNGNGELAEEVIRRYLSMIR